MLSGILQKVKSNYVNFRGWSTNKKIVVIESDDWGAVRMPSREVYDKFMSQGYPVNKHYFAKNDCLESNEDLELLFDVLNRHKDKNGNPAVITANAVVVNPDFDKIAENGKQKYEYELITDTYKSYPEHDRVMDMWVKEGMGNKMLWPQYHGREHINVQNWMKVINSDSKAEQLAFNTKTLLGMKVPGEPVNKFNYMAAFEYTNQEQKKQIEEITREGLDLFEEMFGFTSKTFIASCGIQGSHIDSVLAEKGVKYHQNGHQFRPMGDGVVKPDQKMWGDKNSNGQTYWRRNATFEPSQNPDKDWVDSCMANIAMAFKWNKPAVINSHRVNYSGGIFQENRDNTLKLLDSLLSAIKTKWPEVEFKTSEDLGALISSK